MSVGSIFAIILLIVSIIRGFIMFAQIKSNKVSEETLAEYTGIFLGLIVGEILLAVSMIGLIIFVAILP